MRRLALLIIFAAVLLAVFVLPGSAFGATYFWQSTWGGSGNTAGLFQFADKAAVDSQHGVVYVADYGTSRVEMFTTDGAYLGQFAVANPTGVAVDPARHRVLVSSAGNGWVEVHSLGGGYITQFGTPGAGNGQFSFPNGLAIDGAGNVYVCDMNDQRIEKFDSSFAYLTQWGSLGSANGQFMFPHGVAVGPNGLVYASDYNNSRVQWFLPDGTYQGSYGSAGADPGQFTNITQIAFTPSGKLVVCDRGNNRLQVVDITAAVIPAPEVIGGPGTTDGLLSTPEGVAVDSGGDVYVDDIGTGRVQKFVLDVTPPVVTDDYDGMWKKGDVTFHLHGSDSQSGFDHFFILGFGDIAASSVTGFWSAPAGALIDTLLTYNGTDVAGNTSATKAMELKADNAAPVTTVSGIPSGWATEPVTVFFTATDIGAGVVHTWYRIDGGAWTQAPGAGLSFASEGTYTLDYYSVDVVNNQEAMKTATVKLDFGPPYAFDTTPPVVTCDADGQWHSQATTVAFGASDDVSGIASVEYQVDGGGWNTGLSVVVPAPAGHGNDGLHKVEYRATDNSSNTSAVKTAWVKIDTRKPHTAVVGVPGGWVNTPVTLQFVPGDVGAGVLDTEAGIEPALPATLADNTLLVSAEGDNVVDYLSADACVDLANIEALQTVHVHIDLTAPTPGASKNVSVVKGKSATFKYTLNDNLSPTSTVKLVIKNKKGKIVKTVALGSKASNLIVPPHAYTAKVKISLTAGAYTWVVNATDQAGNTADSNVKKLTVK